MGKIRSRSGQVIRGAGRRRLGAVAVLIASAASFAFGQFAADGAATGRLSGKLTDLHSRPVDGAAMVLRNAATGAEARTTTARDGSYRFSGLTPGEYTLDAGSPRLGEGHITGIFVAPGHESRVQAAVALDRQPPEPLISPSQIRSFADPAPATVSRPEIAAAKPQTFILPARAALPVESIVTVQAELSFVPLTSLSLASRSPLAIRSPEPVPPAPSVERAMAPAAKLALNADPTPPLSISAQLNPIASSSATLAIMGTVAAPVVAQFSQALPGLVTASSAPGAQAQTTLPTLSDQQLQALPLSGRRWENFVLDPSAARSDSDEDKSQPASPARGNPASVSVDSANTQLAFGRGGRRRGASLMGPGSNEAAILEVRPNEKSADPADQGPGDHTNVETRGGTEQLHGQAFVFDRQNLWGAQNPYTQWVKETARGSGGTMPVFTPLPYTAPDHEDRWGLGVGSRIKSKKLFWFAAYDGSLRNDPGVSSVKHPDNFFAQPRNDEMQVLAARLGLPSTDPVAEGLDAYSGMLESLGGLLGPAARTANQWVGFGRLDWRVAERHRFTLEGTGARSDSPGGGLTRVAEPYGSHSFGTSRASEIWVLGRWEAYVTANLLSVTQGSVGRHILSESADPPSPFEQSLNINAWRQLPQIVVDSRYGFTIGNPSRFGAGSYPDEHLYEVQQAVNWVHGSILVKAGVDWRHNADATSMVRNHTGTYHYSTVENFASDALAFGKYGISGQLDRFDQHNCDQRGRAWRDSNNQLRGLGYLPCYSYYSQTIGPTEWHLSTNDLAGYATAQWQPAKRFVMSAALRWDREYLPPPIALVDNPALPLTRKVPSPGNQWGPRVSMAWGSGESRWPVLRVGYGMYYGRTQNSVLETALTQTGSLKGDLRLFMRPTDNLGGGGAPPFPYVLAGTPASVVKPGAVEFSPAFKNAEIHQAEATVETKLPGHVQVIASAMVSLARRLPVSLDTNFDPATNPGTITYAVVDGLNAGPLKARQVTVPFYASWPDLTGTAGRMNANYQQITELASRANSTYEAAMLRVTRNARRGISIHARYTYGHAMDWNPNESTAITGSSVLDPLDFSQEYGTSDLDIRHTVSSMLIWRAPWNLKGAAGRLANGWMLSGVGQFHSGLPFTMRTAGSIPELFTTSGAAIVGLGTGMNGYGGDNRVYGVGRNTYRYPFTWKADARLGKTFKLGQTRELELLAESFNLFNHQNVTRLETIGYSVAAGSAAGSLPTLNFLTGLKTGQTEFGKPLDVNATDYFRPRQFDFGMRMRF